jgi:F1F0 ATPase subunit 2
MSAAPRLIAAFAGGVVLGIAVFGGLWLTLRRLDRARHPALRMLASGFLRLGLVLAAFYALVTYWGWREMLAAALGMTLARFAAVRVTRTEATQRRFDA